MIFKIFGLLSNKTKKQQFLTFEELQPENVWSACMKNERTLSFENSGIRTSVCRIMQGQVLYILYTHKK